MNKQEILKQYANEEDKLFIAKVMDKLNTVNMRNYMTSTDFLDLHQQKLAQDFLKKQKVNDYFFFGGNEYTERKILFLFPDKLNKEIALEEAKNWIQVVRIELPKYNNDVYTHRDYLGGMIKLGIKRDKTGDIFVYPEGADIVVQKEIAQFLQDNLSKLTRFSKSNIEVLHIKELKLPEIKYEESTIIVPSLRMDSVVSEILRISRNKTSQIIEEERIFINFELCTNRSKILKIGDKISIRGKGRFEIAEELGSTKKDNIKLKILKYIWCIFIKRGTKLC